MKIVIYGADYCPYCQSAKKLVEKHNRQYTYVETTTPEGEKQREQLGKQYNWQTIPMIFVDGKFVGGFDDFSEKVKKKEIVLW